MPGQCSSNTGSISLLFSAPVGNNFCFSISTTHTTDFLSPPWVVTSISLSLLPTLTCLFPIPWVVTSFFYIYYPYFRLSLISMGSNLYFPASTTHTTCSFPPRGYIRLLFPSHTRKQEWVSFWLTHLIIINLIVFFQI